MGFLIQCIPLELIIATNWNKIRVGDRIDCRSVLDPQISTKLPREKRWVVIADWSKSDRRFDKSDHRLPKHEVRNGKYYTLRLDYKDLCARFFVRSRNSNFTDILRTSSLGNLWSDQQMWKVTTTSGWRWDSPSLPEKDWYEGFVQGDKKK